MPAVCPVQYLLNLGDLGGIKMSKDERKQQQIIRASKQLAMLATLRLKGLITEQEYDIVVASIYRDYPVIAGVNLK